MTGNLQNSKLLSTRFLKPVLAMLAVCSFYLGITWYQNLMKYFINTTPALETQLFGGHLVMFVQTQNVSHFDQPKWRLRSLYEIFDKHKSRTSESCNNFCDVKQDMGCAATTLDAWQKATLSPEFKFMPLLSDFEYIYPFEVDYLSHPPMTDSKVLPSLNLSKVYVGGTGSGEVLCSIGGTLRGRVDLVDGYGKQRTMGGDEVRVWMVDTQTKKYRAAGHVTDMKNGSYQLSVRCLWPGKSQVGILRTCFIYLSVTVVGQDKYADGKVIIFPGRWGCHFLQL